MDQKPKNMLIVDPPTELRFCGPFSRPVVTMMKVINPTNHMMVFKIKTTAPKRYCVRPNFGSVDPRSSKIVEICLQPFVYDPNEKNKHKFMVQSLVLPNGEMDDLNKVWKEADPEQLMDAKLKCVFELPTASPFGEASGTTKSDGTVSNDPVVTNNEKKILNSLSQEPELVAEMKQIRDENRTLKEENITLKEEVMRLRVTPITKEEPYTPMAPNQIPMFYIAIAIAAALLGLLLGKFLL